MLPIDFRFQLTIVEIATSDAFEENEPLFMQGIELLHKRIQEGNFEEFEPEETDLLTEIFTKIEEQEEIV